MTLKDLVAELDLEVKSGENQLTRQVTRGYASDLMSDVIAGAMEGDVWVTLQVHPNIVAVASLNDLAGIVIVNSRQPEENTLKKAESENIPIMISALPAFELVGRLHALGISGKVRDAGRD